MKLYRCDICKAEICEASAIGIYKYGNVGWTIRKMSQVSKEANDEQHVCGATCLCKFFVGWLKQLKKEAE